MSSQLSENRGATTRMMVVWGALAACAVWALWSPAVVDWVQRWTEDPTYSHGFIVPIFALGLLWWKRREIAAVVPRANWWGVFTVAAGAVVQSVGSYLYIRSLHGVALVLYLVGASLIAGGWPLLKCTWQAIGFLVFMVPPPVTIETALRQPLMQIATNASTFLLQMLGMPALAEGNIIRINEYELGVVEACSGLKMLFTFVALAFGLVIVIKRPLLDKVIILASAVPIAVASNIIRITATGILYVTMGKNTAEFVYHDLAGYLMMPLGIAFMWVVMKILEYLFIEPRARSIDDLRPLILGNELGVFAASGKPKPKL
jgi:exosortase